MVCMETYNKECCIRGCHASLQGHTVPLNKMFMIDDRGTMSNGTSVGVTHHSSSVPFTFRLPFRSLLRRVNSTLQRGTNILKSKLEPSGRFSQTWSLMTETDLKFPPLVNYWLYCIVITITHTYISFMVWAYCS